MSRQEILGNWIRLKKDLDNIRDREEGCILIGDWNRALGDGETGVKGNNPKFSYGGQLMKQLFQEEEYFLLNGSQLAQGGPWTWVSRADPKIRSCINLVAVSPNLKKYISSLEVDSSRNFAPCKVAMKKGKRKLIYSDHFPLILKLEMPKRGMKTVQQSYWNLQTPGGWGRYRELSEEISGKNGLYD